MVELTIYLQIVRDLQRFLPRLQPRAVVGREVAHAAETLALPPVLVRGVDHRHLVTRLQIQLVLVPRREVIEHHVQVGG